MKPPSRNVSASLRGQSPSREGPGPTEKGRIKQGQSAGIWPGERTSGEAAPGRIPSESARHFADKIKPTGGV